jgi:hypothetical protein
MGRGLTTAFFKLEATERCSFSLWVHTRRLEYLHTRVALYFQPKFSGLDHVHMYVYVYYG